MGAARWEIGSWQRVVHASVLGLLQPVVPIALFAGLAPLLFDAAGELVSPSPMAFAAVVLVAAVALGVLLGGGLVAVGRVSLGALGFRRDRLALESALGLGALVVYLACYYLIVRSLMPSADSIFRSVVSQTPSQRALLLLVGLAIAIFEESVFRGYLQPSLVHHLGLVGGVVVTALIFAAWHPPRFALPSFLIRLVLGLVTGACRGRDRPLTGAIAAHALLWPVVGLS